MSIFDKANPVKIGKDIAGKGQKAILREINHLKDEAVKEIRHAAEQGLKEIREQLAAIEGKLAGRSAQQVLRLLVDIVKTVNPSDVSIHIGPLKMDIGNVVQKVGVLEHYSHHPPEKRSEWKAFIQGVSPESLSIVASIGFAFIIESSDLEVGIEATWKGEDVINNIDNILSKAGIH